MNSIEYILNQLNISENIISIYPYGSKIYGTYNNKSDDDYIIVTKTSLLKSGAFRDNAISNIDRTIQGVLYSRSGFIDAINNYYMPAMECLSLNKEDIILEKMSFSISKWNEKDLIKSVIKQMSASWHIAGEQSKNDNIFDAKRGIFHALRILNFGIQLKRNKKIVDFTSANDLYKKIQEDKNFDDRNYLEIRNELRKMLETPIKV